MVMQLATLSVYAIIASLLNYSMFCLLAISVSLLYNSSSLGRCLAISGTFKWGIFMMCVLTVKAPNPNPNVLRLSLSLFLFIVF